MTVDSLRADRLRETSKLTYHNVWKNFNDFIIDFNLVPLSWEKKLVFFCTYLVEECKVQSSTLKTYISAIKSTLLSDGYLLSDDQLLLNCITRTCRKRNDRIYNRMPIGKNLLDVMLLEVERKYSDNQPYLEILYKVAFLLAYYGLLRVSELTLTSSKHAIKAQDIHTATNKSKILIQLHSSKTHGKESRAQNIKIVPNPDFNKNQTKLIFCPFEVTECYLKLQGNFCTKNQQFLVFADGSPVTSRHFRMTMRDILSRLNLDNKLYDTHSFRIGRANDMLKAGYTIDQIKLSGRWKSNAIFKYLRSLYL